MRRARDTYCGISSHGSPFSCPGPTPAANGCGSGDGDSNRTAEADRRAFKSTVFAYRRYNRPLPAATALGRRTAAKC
jgi:hypothetical protein